MRYLLCESDACLVRLHEGREGRVEHWDGRRWRPGISCMGLVLEEVSEGLVADLAPRAWRAA